MFKSPKARKVKKTINDELSPPKKHHFSVSELASLDPKDPHGDLFWNSPTSKTSSQFVVQALKENANEHRQALLDRQKELKLFISSKGNSGSPGSKADGSRPGSRSGSKSPTRRKDGVADSKKDAKGRPEGKEGERKKTSTIQKKPHYIGPFPSSQPKMTEEEEKLYYEKLYPFNYLTLQEFETTASSIERVYHIEELTGRKEETSKSRTMEAVVLYCRYLEDQAHVALKAATFVDCMGCGGETCLYASAFHFQKIISIEITERSKYTAIRAISAIKGLPRQCMVLCGTVKDYFPYDADVYYYDLLWVSDGRTWVDESVLIDGIFRLCEKVQTPVAYLALLTVTSDIKAAKDYNAPHMKLVMSTKVHFGQPDEATIWLYQVVHLQTQSLSASVSQAVQSELKGLNTEYAPKIPGI